MSRLLCIGECMAELAPLPRPDEFRLGYAGDTFNTAWYVARLRPTWTVSYLTAIGDDAMSRRMRDFFVASGVDTTYVRTVPDRTVGLYMIALERGERSFTYWRDSSAARLLAEDAAALVEAMTSAELVYFSGITLAILDQDARGRLLRAAADARAAGATIAFDPNLRPRLWRDPSEMTAAVIAASEVADLVLPSFEDEARWFGDSDPAKTADRYAMSGVTTVVVKNGASPVHYRHEGQHGEIEVPTRHDIVDTTAAGDSFNAGVFAGIFDGQSLPQSIARATRLAGEVVGDLGALVPVEPSEIDA